MRTRILQGFSKLTETQKRNLIAQYCKEPGHAGSQMDRFLFSDAEERKNFLELSENTISSFHLPYGIVPNIMVDGKIYHAPMAVEESSVVAAASHSARFWADHGGFRVKQISTDKLGHVYFRWFGEPVHLTERWDLLKLYLLERLKKVTASMVHRGGGILRLELLNETASIDHLYKLELEVDTVNSMGANFINTCLEDMAEGIEVFFGVDNDPEGKVCQVVMAILSNNTVKCTVTLEASCPVPALERITEGMPPAQFADKMVLAYQIAHNDPFRAATHNKGIMNGVDAVLIATGNDFRSAEAASHAFASRSGQYRGLSWCSVKDNQFTIGLTLPLAVGTVGGITNLHPLAQLSLEILGNPSARELMGIVCAAGLATNFAAVRSLVTTGIQKGHMRLHLSNMLNALNATAEQRKEAELHFRGKRVSYSAVKNFVSGKGH